MSPASARSGGSVTISVTCGHVGGTAPRTMNATSRAFTEGKVALRLASGGEDGGSGPVYRGIGRISATENAEGGKGGVVGGQVGGAGGHPEGVGGAAVGAGGPAKGVAAGRDSVWTVGGTCPAARGGKGKQWTATFTLTRGEGEGAGEGGSGRGDGHGDGSGVGRGDGQGSGDGSGREEGQGRGEGDGNVHRPCPTGREGHESTGREHESTGRGTYESGSCAPATVDHGVHAGAGGAFTDSAPALVAGGLLIAGAFGGAAYRLRRRTLRAEG
ncbi:hypothetical protein ACFXAZ_27365 [Streptomyces sp. NPDC059477]|uniref:hypothetical protein n=1 Tax=Streptomyces sp. NPDC059477 TaxID=3346847 RepID=UPI0036C67B46